MESPLHRQEWCYPPPERAKHRCKRRSCRQAMHGTYNITGNEVTGLNLLFSAIANDSSSHSDTSLQLSHDVTGLSVIQQIRASAPS